MRRLLLSDGLFGRNGVSHILVGLGERRGEMNGYLYYFIWLLGENDKCFFLISVAGAVGKECWEG